MGRKKQNGTITEIAIDLSGGTAKSTARFSKKSTFLYSSPPQTHYPLFPVKRVQRIFGTLVPRGTTRRKGAQYPWGLKRRIFPVNEVVCIRCGEHAAKIRTPSDRRTRGRPGRNNNSDDDDNGGANKRPAAGGALRIERYVYVTIIINNIPCEDPISSRRIR